jgi:hypothetical protein
LAAHAQSRDRARHPGDGLNSRQNGRNVLDQQARKLTQPFKGIEDVKGRWRGGRVLGTSEIRYADWPTTEEVIEKGTDISDKVLRYLVAISHY